MAKLTRMTAARYGASLRRWLLSACLMLAAASMAGEAGAGIWPESGASRNVVEQQVKAAYLSKFASYVEWPPQAFAAPDSPFRIGVVGADTLADYLVQIIGSSTIKGRRVTVYKLQPDDRLDGLHVLFVGHVDDPQQGAILAAASKQPILTVTDSAQGLALGSMINFVVVDGKLRFEVAPRTSGPGRLDISARLLAVAYRVVTGAS